jgi:predicted DsbA family dithiol-disulfide isomerase
VLASDRFAAEVRDDEQLGAQLGIRGVPFFVLGRRYGVSGAQPSDALLGALEQAWEDAAARAA